MTRIPRVLVCVTGQKSCEHLIHVGAEIAREDGAAGADLLFGGGVVSLRA